MKYYFSLWREGKIICKKDDMYVCSTNQKENIIYTLVKAQYPKESQLKGYFLTL